MSIFLSLFTVLLLHPTLYLIIILEYETQKKLVLS